MARSRARKSKVMKLRQERTAQHLEHRGRKAEIAFIHDLVQGILQDRPPVKGEEPMTLEQIEQWFDTDPEAPVILYSMPGKEPSRVEDQRIQISVNQHGVERELRARGINESHASWELACTVVGPALRDTTKEILAEMAYMYFRGEVLPR